MFVKDLIVTGDAKILGNLYTKDGNVGSGGGGGGEGGSGVTYKLTKNGSTITLTGSDGSSSSVNDSDTTTPVDLSGYVPTSRTINGKALTGNISLSAGDVGAAPASHGTHLTLGTGSGNAYYGDKGKIAYDHSQTTHAPSNAQKNSDITKAEIEAKLTGTITSHSHNYAGSSRAGGSANSAVKLDTTTAGSATQPVYFTGGKPVACTYTLGKSVPSDAKFTDTTYTLGSFGITASAAELNYCKGVTSNLQTQINNFHDYVNGAFNTVGGNLSSLDSRISAVENNTRIVSAGKSGVWSYEVYSNNRVLMYANIPVTNVKIDTQFGGVYRSLAAFKESDYKLPIHLQETNPICTVEYQQTNNVGAWSMIGSVCTSTEPPGVYLIRPTTGTTSGLISIVVRGTMSGGMSGSGT